MRSRRRYGRRRTVLSLRADNGVEAEVAGAVRATVERYGSLTTLVNNAISDDAAAAATAMST